MTLDLKPQSPIDFCRLSGNMLKIIAALSMTVDHVGLVIFPNLWWMRIIGRLAFPIFAFMIAEGCRYTKNKLRYFLTVFGVAVVCQVVYAVYSQSFYMCILVTFSLSIALIYALQYMKRTAFAQNASKTKRVLSVCLFFGSVLAVLVINFFVDIDYGFFGIMVPVFTSIFENESELPTTLKRIGISNVRVLTMGLGLLLMAVYYGGFIYYSLFALPLLLLYSGKRGKLKLKYFFYVFYPAHLLLINAIDLIL